MCSQAASRCKPQVSDLEHEWPIYIQISCIQCMGALVAQMVQSVGLLIQWSRVRAPSGVYVTSNPGVAGSSPVRGFCVFGGVTVFNSTFKDSSAVTKSCNSRL